MPMKKRKAVEAVEETKEKPPDYGYYPVINCWSGPRSLSTSLMYSFHNRGDVKCFDEPFYAHYLTNRQPNHRGQDRPYHNLVVKEGISAFATWRDFVMTVHGFKRTRIHFLKHMAKHAVVECRDPNTPYMLNDMDPTTRPFSLANILKVTRNFILVRHPEDLVRSFNAVIPPTLEETCLPAQVQIFMLHAQHRGNGSATMPVVLSEDLRENPEGTLRALCEAIGIEFKPEMLRWEAGARPEIDGCWAPWWYKTTHESTRFEPPRRDKPPSPPLSAELSALVDECMPYYQFLRSHALKPQAVDERRSDGATTTGNGKTSTIGKTSTPSVEVDGGPASGTHAYAPDPRNASVLIGMRDGVTGAFSLIPRVDAKVSVFDSGFVLGDGVWEGVRLHGGVLLYAAEHVKRLFQGAKAIDMDVDVTPGDLIKMMYDTVDANEMHEGVHIRLMVTRGLKSTPYQNPTFTVGKPTIVIAAEHKAAAEGPKVNGMRLMTTHVRRGAPDVQDPAWNSHSKLNCIAACIQANKAGVDESLMLDPHGFVATCNSVHFFIVVDGVVLTSKRKYILHGITRDNVMRIARGLGMETREEDFTLTAVYSADECFVTGTFAGVLPVREVDGRKIGTGERGPVVGRLQEAYVKEADAIARRGRGC